MILGRITHFSLAWLLSASSISFALQLQKSVPKIAVPSTLSHAGIVNKMKPAQLHTPVSSHVHFPKQATIHHPVIKRFGVGGKSHSHSILRAHKTSVGTNSGSVTLSVNIGKPTTSVSRVAVTNAPQGMKFSKVGWGSLGKGMPPGVSMLSAHRGVPEYPMLNFTFAVPENANNITPILKTTFTTPLGNIHFLPSAKTIKGKLQRVYDAASNSISPTITISKPRIFRSLRMVTVSVPLVTSNGNEASALEAFTVGINFSTTSAPTVSSSATRDPLFADLDSRMVANTWDRASFAVPLRRSQKPLAAKPVISKDLKFSTLQNNPDSIYSWIDTSAAYIRLAVTRDGLYRVNASDLNFGTLGFTLASSGWNAHNIRCFNHGLEIPIWIDSDASGNIADIEFYGQHLRGFPLPTVLNPYLQFDYQVQEGNNFTLSDSNIRLPEYYNVATDTNVYWLTASGRDNAVKRYLAKSLVPSNAPIVSSGMVFLHHEEDKNYYIGDASPDETQTEEMTEYAPGERFEWAELHGTDDNAALSHFTDTFYVAQLPSDTASKVATLNFLFRGMSSENDDLGHTVQAEVGGVKSLQTNFSGFQYDSLTMAVPLSRLVVGPNVVRVNAFTLGDSIDQFYLDYYEVRLQSALAPSNDTGIAKGQWFFSIAPSSQKFQLAMTDGTAHLYNLTDNTRILNPSGQFFDSTSSIQPQYAAATTGTLLKCDNIQPWNTGSPNVLSWQILKSSRLYRNHAP
jgi:hypothetical protein